MASLQTLGIILENKASRKLNLKFIYSEKATKFCEISTVDLTVTTYTEQIYGEDFTKFCGLLKIFELYQKTPSAKNMILLTYNVQSGTTVCQNDVTRYLKRD